MHDPTQKDMQFPDVGTQYRSEIFYENDEQKIIAFKIKGEMNWPINQKVVNLPISRPLTDNGPSFITQRFVLGIICPNNTIFCAIKSALEILSASSCCVLVK